MYRCMTIDQESHLEILNIVIHSNNKAMCSNYYVYSRSAMLHALGIETQESLDLIEGNILPYKQAPVVVQEQSKMKLTPMSFSLVPSWSKEPKVKFATHNARIETVLEKPTWREPFLNRHCIVPLTSFFEPIYEGEFAGNIVDFHRPDKELLFAAGIWDEWKNAANGESLQSFSILTTEPTEFVNRIGHDRCPIFLKSENIKSWLNAKLTGQDQVHFLLDNFEKPELSVSAHRAMKPGWEKRK